MSEKLIQNGSVKGSESSPAEKESLLKIRDILFGDQVIELSTKIKTTEVEFNKQLGLLKSIQTRSTTALKDKVANNRTESRELLKTSLDKLEQKIEAELTSIKNNLGDLDSRLSSLAGEINTQNGSFSGQLSGVDQKLESLRLEFADMSANSIKKDELAQTLRLVAESIK